MKLKEMIGKISEDDLRMVLEQMSIYEEFHEKIEQIVVDHLKEDALDVDGIAENVKMALEFIDIDELFDSSGPSRHGYIDPNEESWEMFEAELQGYIDIMKEYCERKLFDEAMRYCMGILLGIYKFEKESNTDFKDWATDAPYYYFHEILKEWCKECPNPQMFEKVDTFVKDNCPAFMK